MSFGFDRLSYWQASNIQRWMLLTPGVLLYGIFNFIPLLSLLAMAMIDWPGIGPWKFVGFDNFVQLLTNEYQRAELLRALGQNVLFFFIVITFMLFIGSVLAMLLSWRVWGRSTYRSVFFLAYPLAGAAVAFLLKLTFDPRGPVNELLVDVLHLFERAIPFLGDTDLALSTLAGFYSWHRMGFAIILILSAMVAVRVSLLEAATLDGASRWQTIRAVVFPVLTPAYVLIGVIVLVDVFNNADYTLILMGPEAGPNRSTDIMGSFLYRTSFGGSATTTTVNFGMAAAIGLLTAIVILPAALFLAIRNLRS